MNTNQPLREFLRSFPVEWTEDSLNELIDSFEEEHLNKGEHFLREGQVCRKIAFVARGCLRWYLIDDDQEKSVFFFVENTLGSDSGSFIKQMPARCYIDALEDSHLLTITLDKVRALSNKHIEVARCHRMVVEALLVTTEIRLMLYLRSNPEERYKGLLENFGDLVNRVPLKHLASYLGITPVSLSRIRARVAASG